MNDTAIAPTGIANAATPELVSYTHWVYALHSLSIVVGLCTGWFVATAFIFSLPSIVAVVMNYVRRSAVRGTWLESHFRWQIRTFWTVAIAMLITLVVSAPFTLVLIGFAFIWFGYIVIGVWLAYRVVRGWLALRDGKQMYA
jgi:uncharacterized membrane protein